MKTKSKMGSASTARTKIIENKKTALKKPAAPLKNAKGRVKNNRKATSLLK
jgi:hypothetical protein